MRSDYYVADIIVFLATVLGFVLIGIELLPVASITGLMIYIGIIIFWLIYGFTTLFGTKKVK